MHRLYAFARSLLLALLILPAGGGSLCGVEDEKTIILSAHPEFPPFMYQNGDTVTGLIPKITSKILSELGFNVYNTYVGPWARVQHYARNGRIDIIAGIYKSEERLTYLEYVPVPVIANHSVVFVKKGREFSFSSWDALKGKKMGAIVGDRFTPEFEDFLRKNVESIPVERVISVTQNFRKLLSERIDFIPYGQHVGGLVSKEMGINDQVEILPNPISTGYVYIAFSKESKYLDYLEKVNELIIRYKEDGTVGQLLEESINEYLEQQG